MGPGLVLYDVLVVAFATVLYGGAAFAAAKTYERLVMYVPWPLALFPAFFVGLIALILEVGVLTALAPRLKPGRYEMMKGPVFFGWILRSLYRRILFAPGLKWFLFSSNVLRWLTMRALGANVAFSTNMSSDVDILDPSLLTAGPGATIGARCLVSGHYVDGGKLVLGPVEIGERSLLAAEVMVGPHVVIGKRVMVKARASVSIGARIGDGAEIGGGAGVDAFAVIGEKAKLDSMVYVAPKTVVAAGARVSRSSDATNSAAPAV